jgi:peptide chain release factor 2
MSQISSRKRQSERWRGLESETRELLELSKLALEQSEGSLIGDIKKQREDITKRLERHEFELLLSGEYDSKSAIIAIHAGAGGTEAQDWTQMLMRMYLRWTEKRGYATDVLDMSPGEEVGLKSVTFEVKGEFAYGYLRSEFGVHRLVRLSPFNADHARHTTFALVEVLPEADSSTDYHINPEELKIEFYRSSGPGGQHMQKTSTAVRVTHLPTGLIATCQSQRSQLQNKESALRVLLSRLMEKEIARKEAERAKIKGERIEAGWSNQIRSYVLHPYKMVKDHRTDYETGNTTSVLDGEIDGFITAFLKSKVGEKSL